MYYHVETDIGARGNFLPMIAPTRDKEFAISEAMAYRRLYPSSHWRVHSDDGRTVWSYSPC
jgi:hypothetical protein